MLDTDASSMELRWRQIIKKTCEAGFLELRSNIIHPSDNGSLRVAATAVVDVYRESAILMGSQTTDGVTERYPESRVVRGDLYLATSDGSWMLLEGAGLASTIMAPLYWARDADSIRPIDDSHAVAILARSQLGDLVDSGKEYPYVESSPAVSDQLEAYLVEDDGIISELKLQVDQAGSNTTFELFIKPITEAEEIVRPPPDTVS